MGLIVPNEKDIQRMLNKYHLNDLSPDAKDIAIQIAKTSVGYEMDSASAQLTLNAKDRAVVSSLSTLIKQNWIVINQLSELTDVLNSIAVKQSEENKEMKKDNTNQQKVEINTEGMTECTVADVIQYLDSNGKTYRDNTSMCGYFWILDDEEVREWIKGKIIEGKVPKYTSCSGALRGCPGWYV